MFSVCKREFTAYFRNMAGYSFLAAFFLMCGYFFTLNNLIGGVSDITGVYSGVYIGMGLLVPLLTMESLLVQTGYGIEYTLYTSSVQLVFGKFFAALALIAVGILGTTVYAGILAIFCKQNLLTLFYNQLGLLLLAADYLTICFFASAISTRRSQALIMSYTLLLMFFMLERSYQSIAGFSQIKTLWIFSFFSAYGNFELGILSPTGILGMIIFFIAGLAITSGMIHRRRERGI